MLAAALALTSAASGILQEKTTTAGGICDATVTQHSGYYVLNETGKTDDHYFYWMLESRNDPKKDPFILWLTGGPGCSGMLALLNENGPCSIEKDASGALNTINNPHSWTNNATVLWIDQPTGVGFSYGAKGDYDHDEKGVRDDVYTFLVEFMTAHPEYADLPLYVFGESYGGHYAQNIAWRIHDGNQQGGAQHLNLAGLAVGNGLTDPVLQYPWYAQMANNNTYGVKSISDADYQAMLDEVPECVGMINHCQNDTSACSQAQAVCTNAQIGPYEGSGLNPYDVRIKCQVPGLCYDFSAPTEWLDSDTTRSALGVTSKSAKWASCNMQVNQQFSSDWMKTQEATVPPLLEAGIRVLIYAGDADFICNWMGNKAWVEALPWAGHAAFAAADDHDWNVGGAKAGTARSATSTGTLTFLQVNGAGHMVPMDQPVNALAMVNTFTSGGKF
jgi:carboxypeptidase C (cathepsin A)